MRSASPRVHLVVALAAFLILPTLGSAQRLGILPVSSESDHRLLVTAGNIIPASVLQSIDDGTVYRRTYWKEGLVGGAIIGVVLGGLAGSALCEQSESTSSCGVDVLKGALILGAPAALLGALVGGLFPKPEPYD